MRAKKEPRLAGTRQQLPSSEILVAGPTVADSPAGDNRKVAPVVPAPVINPARFANLVPMALRALVHHRAEVCRP